MHKMFSKYFATFYYFFSCGGYEEGQGRVGLYFGVIVFSVACSIIFQKRKFGYNSQKYDEDQPETEIKLAHKILLQNVWKIFKFS